MMSEIDYKYPLNIEDWAKRKEELLSKFSKGFENKLYNNAIAHKVFEYLMHGGDVYRILEQLLDRDKEAMDKIDELIKFQPPAPVIISKEQYERFKSTKP